MRTLPLLILCLLPSLCRAQRQQPIPAETFSKQMGPGDQVVVVEDDDKGHAKGAGGRAIGKDVKLVETDSKPPSLNMPWGSGMGGSADTSLSAAASVYGSMAFRWIAGIVGLLSLLGGYFIARQGNPRGAMVVGGSGLGLIVGTIFFPEWLELGLLAFFAVHLIEYAHAHSLFTGTLATITTAAHNAGSGVSAAFNAAVNEIVEPAEAQLINRVAKANNATSVKVQA